MIMPDHVARHLFVDNILGVDEIEDITLKYILLIVGHDAVFQLPQLLHILLFNP